jgi:hypothetical protein
MVLYSGAIGDFGSFFVGIQARICIACQVMLFLPFCFKDAGCVAGDMVGVRLDLARSPFGGVGRQRRAQIQGPEELGRGLGRWATADSVFKDGCLPLKASGQWSSSGPRWCTTSSSAAVARDDDSRHRRSTLDRRTSM